MGITTALLDFIFGLLSEIIPVFNLDSDFLNKLDSAFSFVVTLILGAGYFVPLDILTICLAVMLAVDNFSLISRLMQFIIKLVRG